MISAEGSRTAGKKSVARALDPRRNTSCVCTCVAASTPRYNGSTPLIIKLEVIERDPKSGCEVVQWIMKFPVSTAHRDSHLAIMLLFALCDILRAAHCSNVYLMTQ